MSSCHHIIISSYHHIIIPSYHHITISPYHRIIVSSYYHIISVFFFLLLLISRHYHTAAGRTIFSAIFFGFFCSTDFFFGEIFSAEIFRTAVKNDVLFFFPARHGVGRGGWKRPERKNVYGFWVFFLRRTGYLDKNVLRASRESLS